jgi:hypothetical protein
MPPDLRASGRAVNCDTHSAHTTSDWWIGEPPTAQVDANEAIAGKLRNEALHEAPTSALTAPAGYLPILHTLENPATSPAPSLPQLRGAEPGLCPEESIVGSGALGLNLVCDIVEKACGRGLVS